MAVADRFNNLNRVKADGVVTADLQFTEAAAQTYPRLTIPCVGVGRAIGEVNCLLNGEVSLQTATQIFRTLETETASAVVRYRSSSRRKLLVSGLVHGDVGNAINGHVRLSEGDARQAGNGQSDKFLLHMNLLKSVKF